MKFDVIKSNALKGLDATISQTSIEGSNLTQTQKFQERESATDSAELLVAALARLLSESQRRQQALQEQTDRVVSWLPENAKIISSLLPAIERIGATQQAQVEEMASLRSTLARMEQQISHVLRMEINQVHNLEQVRLQGDGLARSLEKLSADFIALQITDPLFKEFGRIYEKLLLLCPLPAAAGIREQIQAVALGIVQFLEERDIEIIHPAESEPFDKRKHRVETMKLTHAQELDARITRVTNIGLSSPTRLIAAARVEAFKYEPPPIVEIRS